MRVFFTAGTKPQKADTVTSGHCFGRVPKEGPRVILRAEGTIITAENITTLAEAPLNKAALSLGQARVLQAMRLGGKWDVPTVEVDLGLDVKGSVAVSELRASNRMTLLFAMSLLCLGMYSSGGECPCDFRKGTLCGACRGKGRKPHQWKLSADDNCCYRGRGVSG